MTSQRGYLAALQRGESLRSNNVHLVGVGCLDDALLDELLPPPRALILLVVIVELADEGTGRLQAWTEIVAVRPGERCERQVVPVGVDDVVLAPV